MGGVDLMDGLMGRYHIRAKSRDAMVRLFYHFIDMAATNAYILYRRMHAERFADMCKDSSLEIPPVKPNLYELPEFREKIAAALVTYTEKRPVGRPSSRPSTPTSPLPSDPCNLKLGQKAKHPVDDIRFDGLYHPVSMLENTQKRECKVKGCTSKTQFFCKKCHLHLCVTKTKNCFNAYHGYE